jgi:shikimate kinase
MNKNGLKNIILTGIKHSGKSTYGNEISRKLDYRFYDLDSIIENKNNRTVRDIYRESEKIFRAIEVDAAVELYEKLNSGNICAALGGSTAQNKKAMLKLRNSGIIVYLYLEPDTLYKRVISTGVPPFLSMENAYDDFKALYKKRDIIHKKAADIVIKLDGLGIEDGTKHILDSIKDMI